MTADEREPAPLDSEPDLRYRRLSKGSAAIDDVGAGRPSTPTWRGWIIGLLGVAMISLIVPYVDYVVRGTRLSLNLMPASSVFLVLGLTLGFNLLLARWRRSLALSRPDLTLIFCMTFVINPLPASGMMSYLTAELFGGQRFATPSNQWEELVVSRIPESLLPRDPQDPESWAPRPVQWFYTGLPEGESIPWAVLIGPYARWFIALLMTLAMFMAVCLLLRRQWSDNEKLTFPMTQVPLEMLDGLESAEKKQPFLLDKLALAGILVTFLLHSYNALQDYTPVIEPIPLRSDDFAGKYLTESAIGRALAPVNFYIYPAIIGITFFISTEVSFSLWFFHWLKKIVIVVLVLGFGLGFNSGSYFGGPGHKGIFANQGLGALLMMVLVGLYMGRKPLLDSLKEAFGGKEATYDREVEGMSARAVWLLLTASMLGSVIWLVTFMELGLGYAVALVGLLLVLNIGMARLVSEAGLYFLECGANPAGLVTSMLTPAALDPRTYVTTSVWSGAMSFDYMRSSPAITMFQSLHLAGQTKTRRSSLVMGLTAAIVVCFVCSFYGFFNAIYEHNQRGLQDTWNFGAYPRKTYGHRARQVQKIEAWQAREAKAEATGTTIPESEVPEVAKVDRWMLCSFALGAGLFLLFSFLRSRLFWWPHPIGFVVWVGAWPMMQMWFSYFLGWLCKAIILKYGGGRVYSRWRRFFIGLIVGELVATVLWVLIAWLTGTEASYTLHFN